jgi:hypothetical protein
MLTDTNNADLRIALLKLISSMLCDHSETLGVKARVIATLLKVSGWLVAGECEGLACGGRVCGVSNAAQGEG